MHTQILRKLEHQRSNIGTPIGYERDGGGFCGPHEVYNYYDDTFSSSDSEEVKVQRCWERIMNKPECRSDIVSEDGLYVVFEREAREFQSYLYFTLSREYQSYHSNHKNTLIFNVRKSLEWQ